MGRLERMQDEFLSLEKSFADFRAGMKVAQLYGDLTSVMFTHFLEGQYFEKEKTRLHSHARARFSLR
jgi:hypothetical protein